MTRRPLVGLMFLTLAGVLAFGVDVDPGKNIVRWIVVPAMVAWGIYSLVEKRDRIDRVYTQLLAMGLAIAAVGWLIPGRDSRGLIVVGGLLVLVSLGLLAWAWVQRRQEDPDDPHRPR